MQGLPGHQWTSTLLPQGFQQLERVQLPHLQVQHLNMLQVRSQEGTGMDEE